MEWCHLSEAELAEAWDEVRRRVLESSLTDLSLRKWAEQIGQSWHYAHGDDELRTLLCLSWSEISELPGFGHLEKGLLLDYVSAAAVALWKTGSKKGVRPAPATKSTSAASTALANLGIEPTVPVELLAISGRARTLLQREDLKDIGHLLDFLAQHYLPSLRKWKGIGSKTARELIGFLVAVSSGRGDLVRQYLPLRASGSGLCFSPLAARFLADETPEDREALSRRLQCGDTLREAAQYSGRTRARIGQIVGKFLKSIDMALSYFPDEKQRFWEAWQRCEPLEDMLGEELDGPGKKIIAAALGQLFASSQEGHSILSHRRDLFASWLEEVLQIPEFHQDGIRVARFVRDKGEPQLLMPLLDYLEKERGVTVFRTSGKALSRGALAVRDFIGSRR